MSRIYIIDPSGVHCIIYNINRKSIRIEIARCFAGEILPRY